MQPLQHMAVRMVAAVYNGNNLVNKLVNIFDERRVRMWKNFWKVDKAEVSLARNVGRDQICQISAKHYSNQGSRTRLINKSNPFKPDVFITRIIK